MTDPQKITHAQAREIIEAMTRVFSSTDYKRLLAYVAQQESIVPLYEYSGTEKPQVPSDGATRGRMAETARLAHG